MELKENTAIIDWDNKLVNLNFRGEECKFNWSDVDKLEDDIWDSFKLENGTEFDINLWINDNTEHYEAVDNADYTVGLTVYGLLPSPDNKYFNTNTDDAHEIKIVKTSGEILNFLREA